VQYNEKYGLLCAEYTQYAVWAFLHNGFSFYIACFRDLR
jgi:hypothetical protein